MKSACMDVIRGQRRSYVERSDCLRWLWSLPAGCLDLIVTSPSYVDARLYLENGQDLRIARDTETWVRWQIEVVRACLHACRGLIVLVIDAPTRGQRWEGAPFLLAADLIRMGVCLRKPAIYYRVTVPGGGGNRYQHAANGGSSDWLRNDWELCLAITHGGRLPWADSTACGHRPLWGPGGACSNRLSDGTRVNQWGGHPGSLKVRRCNGSKQPAGRPGHRFQKAGAINGYRNGDTHQNGVYEPPALSNPGNVLQASYTADAVSERLEYFGDVLHCNVGGGQMGDRLCHLNEAPFAERLAEFWIRSFCPPDGLVGDCNAGSGTTQAIAERWGRRSLGCDLRGSQVRITRRRVGQERWNSRTPAWWPVNGE